jgi:tyrosine decarboxylase/aspartate 1-decarboxylase
MDPVAEIADIAERRGVYCHVDAAFGGFMLPFVRELGEAVPQSDFSLPGVSSLMTDGHKHGMLPTATSFLLIRDAELLSAIPTERTVIPTLTATKPGSRAVAAWAVLKHLGFTGYLEIFRRFRTVISTIAREPTVGVVNFTSDTINVERLFATLHQRGWGTTYGVTEGMPHIRISIHPSHTLEEAEDLVDAISEVAEELDRSGLNQ